jgi:signal transduction histidine kinase
MNQTEEQIRTSEAFNLGVLNSLSSNIAVINNDGLIVAVNESWKRAAFEHGETLAKGDAGSNYFRLCARAFKEGDDMAADVLQGIADVMDDKLEIFHMEYPCHTWDEQRWFAIRISKFENGEPMVVASHQEITERKLAEEKLILKNKELQKTNSELDSFVYSVSHDLRSPLTSVLGLLSFIEEESREPATTRHATMIRQSISRMDGFIKNVLSYSRNNRTALEPQRIELEKTINEVIDSLRYMENAEGIVFNISIAEDRPFYSDKQRFTTVIENLISNAIKFHRQDDGERHINLNCSSDKDYMTVVIKDNGIGIEPEYKNKIFDMFFRISGKVPGSGIGLYIVKEIVEKLQGMITMESKPGVGTAFKLKIKNLIP